eukprot:CAMPEP_0185579718 /NCGR_PEP_ID=MMETSP0434-20130131/15374_1 /TAXON_ID=626734 ORGANISM="Favella taraikaensis, Strain Fe Narragansett Bay" /NCGR_SAMPLE_ID=MMETSP0434 /ASSEMBLY_ACC=CAM_ASM_000379 /LENGTH=63 /DNA_ID=CAMNT_0028197803 /DNA_START=314 /DNA_END=505 /DNA_ORIENTATION=-
MFLDLKACTETSIDVAFTEDASTVKIANFFSYSRLGKSPNHFVPVVLLEPLISRQLRDHVCLI